jgi:hypothetical protein
MFEEVSAKGRNQLAGAFFIRNHGRGTMGQLKVPAVTGSV